MSASFDPKYHARFNRGAGKISTANPCQVCGWARHMAIHDRQSSKACGVRWAHKYVPPVQTPALE